MSSEQLHEDPNALRDGALGDGVIDRHRAIASVMEELEAVDWYDQRVAATSQDDLAAVLAHNRDEEKEHAAMLLEWLRRHDPVLDRHLRTYLFTEGSIVGIEGDAEGEDRESLDAADAAEGTPGGAGDLGVGALGAPGIASAIGEGGR